ARAPPTAAPPDILHSHTVAGKSPRARHVRGRAERNCSPARTDGRPRRTARARTSEARAVLPHREQLVAEGGSAERIAAGGEQQGTGAFVGPNRNRHRNVHYAREALAA